MKKEILSMVLVLTLSTPSFAFMQGNVAKNSAPVKEQEMTLGIVQKQIKIGASQDDVAISLGSPNIVTKDAEGKDTWIYDKISSVTYYDNNGFGIGASGGGGGVAGGLMGLLTGGFGGGGGLFNIGYNKDKGNVQSVQKTLTVVIKFDKNNAVESFTYHMSKF